jgi:hypothetical protein
MSGAAGGPLVSGLKVFDGARGAERHLAAGSNQTWWAPGGYRTRGRAAVEGFRLADRAAGGGLVVSISVT